jgi:hypothetical protein
VKGVIAIDIDKVIIKGKNTQKIKKKSFQGINIREQFTRLSISFPF